MIWLESAIIYYSELNGIYRIANLYYTDYKAKAYNKSINISHAKCRVVKFSRAINHNARRRPTLMLIIWSFDDEFALIVTLISYWSLLPRQTYDDRVNTSSRQHQNLKHETASRQNKSPQRWCWIRVGIQVTFALPAFLIFYLFYINKIKKMFSDILEKVFI